MKVNSLRPLLCEKIPILSLNGWKNRFKSCLMSRFLQNTNATRNSANVRASLFFRHILWKSCLKISLILINRLLVLYFQNFRNTDEQTFRQNTFLKLLWVCFSLNL